jgi:hypothetical protein
LIFDYPVGLPDNHIYKIIWSGGGKMLVAPDKIGGEMKDDKCIQNPEGVQQLMTKDQKDEVEKEYRTEEQGITNDEVVKPRRG